MHSLIYLCLLVLLPVTSVALDNDRSQPISIEADSLKLDQNTGTSIYEGQVVVQQGSLKLTGQRLVIRTDNETPSALRLSGTPRQRATLEQLLDNQQLLQAQAVTIDYADNEVLLLQDAELYRGQDVVRSQRIRYLLEQNQVIAGRSSASDLEGSLTEDAVKNKPTQERVKIILTPTQASPQ